MGIIPEGSYCYGQNGLCVFWTHKNIFGINIPYCSHLLRGDVSKISDHDFQFLKKKFHCSCDEDLYKIFKGELLWDRIKECGINDCE